MDRTIVDLMAFAMGESDLEPFEAGEEDAGFALNYVNSNIGLMPSQVVHPRFSSFSPSSVGDINFLGLDSSLFNLNAEDISKCCSPTPTLNGTALNEATAMNVMQISVSQTNVFPVGGSLPTIVPPTTTIPLPADDQSTMAQDVSVSAPPTPQHPPANNPRKRGRKPKPKDGATGKSQKPRKKYMLPPTDPNYHAKDVKNARQAKFNRDQKKQLYVDTANENAKLKETIATKDETIALKDDIIIKLREKLVRERGLRRAMQDNLATIRATFDQNFNQLKGFKTLLGSLSNGDNKSNDQQDVVP